VTDTTRRLIALVIVGILALLHHDFWLWDNGSLVAGFIPAGLAYHAIFSVVASLVWALVVYLAWAAITADEQSTDR
jgi:hypothetical protein